MKRSQVEVMAKRAFAKHLTDACPEIRQSWSCPDPDPPDFALEVSGMNYAVEVTAVTGAANPEISGGPNQLALVGATEKWVKKIGKIARQAGILRGTYNVGFNVRPDVPQLGPGLQEQALEFIRSTETDDVAPSQYLYASDGGHVTIQKVGGSGNHVGRSATPGARWEGDIANELPDLLRTSMNGKIRKLKNIPKPWVLLWVDRYLFGNAEDWTLAVKQLEERVMFHTVARVHSGPLQMLHGGKSWCKGSA